MAPKGRPPVQKSSKKKPSGHLLPFRVGFGIHSTATPTLPRFSSSLPSQTEGTSLSSSSPTPTPVEDMEDLVCSSPTHATPTEATTEDVGSRIDTSETSEASSTAKNPKKRKWSADTWKEYDLYDGDVFEDGIPRAVCKYCKRGPILANSPSGTSNFTRHTTGCRARLLSIDGDGLTCKNGKVVPKFDQSIYKEMIALAIIRHGYPFTYAEHEGNRELHLLLNEDCKPICRNTAKNHVMKIHNREKQRLRFLMMNVSGKICLTSDMWTSVVDQGYLSLTAHYIDDDWNLHAELLSFCHVEPPHTARVLHDIVLGLLKEWRIHRKVFSITLDNARCNDNMQVLLAESLSLHCSLPCDGDYFHVRCSAHVLNLIVQDGLKVILVEVKKVRKLVCYNVASERRMLRFLEVTSACNVDCTRKLSLDCPTRWNSTYKMLERALVYRVPLSKRSDSSYPHILSEEEWFRIEKICALLKPFDELTTLISGKKYPTSNLYLKTVWSIELLLLKYASCDDQILRDMAVLMKLKFDKYWDSYSVVLSFAAILDPRYKFQFVDFCFQELDKVLNTETAESRAKYVKEEFQKLFNEYANHTSTQEREGSMNMNQDHEGDDLAAFADFGGCCEEKSELDLYLEASRLKHTEDLDVLLWWKENSTKYPVVAQMAKDILAIPITTVASESTFSMGSRVITKWRSSLHPFTADALLTTRTWLFGFHVKEEPNEHQDIQGLEYQMKETSIS